MSSERTQKASFYKGPLAWMTQNSVAANLMMFLLLIGGFVMLGRLKQEVFPEVDLDTISVNVAYPGASPSEVEQGAILAVEEAVRGVEGIKKITATANEGSAMVNAELLISADPDEALNDIKSAVDRITSFPADSERPVISLLSNRRAVVSVVISGDHSETTLKKIAERVREELLARSDITVVEITGLRDPEISIEVPQENLRRYNLTLDQVSQSVRLASVELPGGGIKTSSGELLLRTSERRDIGEEFKNITLLSQPDGTKVTVGEVADVRDGFQEVDQFLKFKGKPAALVTVYRVGEQTPIEISDSVQEYLGEHAESFPPGVELSVWDDQSEIYRDRINLLLRNAFQGLILVLLVLGLFLEIRLAFWVTLGIPISFLGAIMFMPAIDVSLNMISLFAFILTLGIVVDDAIVVGEAVFKHRKDGMSPLDAAISGVKEVAVPVVFSVLTTVIAFSPLLFVPGVRGKFFKVIPLVVIPILLLSLVESLLILPAHLAHGKPPSQKGFLGMINRSQQWFSNKLEYGIERYYQPIAQACIRQRYLTISIGVACLILTFGAVGGGLVKFVFFPKVEGDTITTNIEMPFGTSAQQTEVVLDEILAGLDDTFEGVGGAELVGRGVLAELGKSYVKGRGGGVPTSGSHVASVRVFLKPTAEREVSTSEFTNKWRAAVGDVAGVESLTFEYNTGPSGGTAVDVELSHSDMSVLQSAATDLSIRLADYDGVLDINDGFALGKEQIDFKLKPAARSLGLTETALARQVRNAFYGSEAVRQQRGRDEVRVFVRRPLAERQSEFALDTLLLRTPQGGEVPLSEAAEIKRGRAYTSIIRQDGRRLVHVTSDVDSKVATANDINASIKRDVLPQLMADYPGLSWTFGGEQSDQAESLGALGAGAVLALFVMFGLMAIPFRSYIQPLIVMSAIPFGVVGAVLGHILMGYDISFISVMGIIALSGVVVNDSLVLVDAINGYRRGGLSLAEAVITGGVRRFRPILLTTLTTFFGLMPMMLERSTQARFLIPMAISLGFGILFVTVITLILVPVLYMIIEDIRLGAVKIVAFYKDEPIDEVERPEVPGAGAFDADEPEESFDGSVEVMPAE
jgi:multidrug efflux pump subunit AcrB